METETAGKPARSSKTIIFNVLATVAAVTGAFGIDVGLTPEVQAEVVVGVVAVANVVLRLITNTGIKGLV